MMTAVARAATMRQLLRALPSLTAILLGDSSALDVHPASPDGRLDWPGPASQSFRPRRGRPERPPPSPSFPPHPPEDARPAGPPATRSPAVPVGLHRRQPDEQVTGEERLEPGQHSGTVPPQHLDAREKDRNRAQRQATRDFLLAVAFQLHRIPGRPDLHG